MTAPRLVRTSLLLVPVQLVGRGGELLLPLFLAAWFGRSEATDVYWFAFALLQLPVGAAVALYQDSVAIPILVEAERRGPAELRALLGALLAYTAAGGVALAIAGAAVAAVVFTVRWDGGAQALALRLLVPLGGWLAVVGLRSLLGAVLTARERFFAPPLAAALGVATNVAVVATSQERGVSAIGLGLFAGELVAIATLAALVRGGGIALRPTWRRPAIFNELFRLAIRQVGGGIATRINPIVAQWVAGLTAVVGGGTLIRYANDLALAPAAALQATLLPVLLTTLALQDVEHRHADFARTVRRTLLVVIALLSSAALAIGLARGPLLELLYGRGEMDAAAVDRLAALLPWYLAGLPSFGAVLVLARAHVARRHVRLLLVAGAGNAALHAILNVALVPLVGLAGVGLATSIVHTAVAVLLWVYLTPPP